ncbi:MAG: hypothetical protein Q4F69_11795 [Bacteroidia bacterium]|nr:hypothetical protein [Bacteroidia bacterium]
MKRLGFIISALALVSGLSQCRQPNISAWSDSFSNETKEISFNAGDGSKANIEDALTALNFKWESGDKLYVYASANGTFDENSKYCGTLRLLPEYDGESIGSFLGQLKNLPKTNVGKLRFFYFGGGVTENDNGATAEISLNQQIGTAAGLKQKVLAYTDVQYDPDKYEYSGKLEVQFAMVRMDLSAFGECNVTMIGESFNKLNVDVHGQIVRLFDGTTVLNGVTEKSTLYVVAVGTNKKAKTPTTLVFSGNNLEGDINIPIKDNVYYYYTVGTDEPAGVPVAVRRLAVFTVSQGTTTASNDGGKKVCFSSGNLQFRASDKAWRFAPNQYDIIGSDNTKIGPEIDSWIDLFGWGTGNVNDDKSYPWQKSTTFSDYYGKGSKELNGGSASKGNLYDWGHNIGDGNTWFTLTKDQWIWLLGHKGDGKVPGETHRFSSTVGKENARFAKIKINGVNGLLIFPDVFEWDADKMGGMPTYSPTGTTTDYINNYNAERSFYDGKYTLKQFAEMEKAGAVFLPAPGYRKGSEYNNFTNSDVRSYYWSSDRYDSKNAYVLKFDYYVNENAQGVNPGYTGSYVYYGFGVRLVREVHTDGNGTASSFGEGTW